MKKPFKFNGMEELPQIDPNHSLFESKRNTEGDWCLFFKKEEVDELMGHKVEFYPNGVLLVLKEGAKDFSKQTNPNLIFESKSFVFYNNEPIGEFERKRPILEIHNRNRDKQTRTLLEPIKDVDVKVFEHFLYVKDGSKIRTIDILTGNEIFEYQPCNQIGFDI